MEPWGTPQNRGAGEEEASDRQKNRSRAPSLTHHIVIKAYMESFLARLQGAAQMNATNIKNNCQAITQVSSIYHVINTSEVH